MTFKTFIYAVLVCLAAPAWAQNAPDKCSGSKPSVHCGKTPSAVWHQGALWVAFVQGEHVYVSRASAFTDKKTIHYSTPVAVNSAPETIESNGENRPKIAVTEEAILVSWTRKTSDRYTGDIRLTRSLDGGKTFEQPKTINDDGNLISHRFDSLLVSPEGTVYLAWLDKRNKLRAEANEQPYAGSAVFVAVSRDHGASFSKNHLIADNSCECCRIAMAPAGEDHLALFWRHIYGTNVRDHSFAVVSPKGTATSLQRATEDDWQINACPHHGPDLAPAQATPGSYHLAWFSDGTRHQGIYYGRRHVESGTTNSVTAMDTTTGASHPQVMEANGKVYFAWKRFDGEQMHIQLATSNDGGQSWSEPRSVAATASASDHPALLLIADTPYLAWYTEAEGFRVIDIDSSLTKANLSTTTSSPASEEL